MERKPSPRKRAKLEDVARAAGVGPMTVSRTINGHPYVAEETAKKVRAAIRRLGYRPNHAARMLTGQLSRSIGLIVPDISDTFFSVFSHAVQETARESGELPSADHERAHRWIQGVDAACEVAMPKRTAAVESLGREIRLVGAVRIAQSS